MSRGDSSRGAFTGGDRGPGLETSASDKGGDNSAPVLLLGGLSRGDSVAVLAKKLGIGREDGAGEAWKVAPAKAAADADLGPPVCGGVRRPCFMGAGDVETFLGRDLLPLRLLDLLLEVEAGAGLFELDLSGVAGPPSGSS